MPIGSVRGAAARRLQRPQRARRDRGRRRGRARTPTRWPRGCASSAASAAACSTAARRRGVTVYDDFAHHPTAIAETLDGVRSAHPDAADLGDLRAAIGDLVPADLPGGLRAGARPGRPRDPAGRLPIDAAGGPAAVGRSAHRRSAGARASTPATSRRSTRSSAPSLARAAQRRPRDRHVEWRLRQHPPEAADALEAAPTRTPMIDFRDRAAAGDAALLVELPRAHRSGDQRPRASRSAESVRERCGCDDPRRRGRVLHADRVFRSAAR